MFGGIAFMVSDKMVASVSKRAGAAAAGLASKGSPRR